ncbi:MAG: EboA domain-containing protein [Chitinophagaceae bacterium]
MEWPPVNTDATKSDYDLAASRQIFTDIIQDNISTDAWGWLSETTARINDGQTLSTAFTQVPRKTGKALPAITNDRTALLQRALPGLSLQTWTVDRLCRVYLLLQLDATHKNGYVEKIETLFAGAELNEQVALYGALPLLAYPSFWSARCAEGIRSNMADVLESIMCFNPYPARYLAEPAWNQMVLKAFFTEKKTEQIIGLEERANPLLAEILIDYAHERWAAQRSVNPLLWRCVSKFITAENFTDIKRVFYSEDPTQVQAAALACSGSPYPPAKALHAQNSELTTQIQNGILTWDSIAKNQFDV